MLDEMFINNLDIILLYFGVVDEFRIGIVNRFSVKFWFKFLN